MVDVFISYKREDADLVRSLAASLEEAGFEVWYDFDLISGDPFRTVIRNVIDVCAVVVVVWSVRSVDSEFVLDEASHAKAQQKLCPVRIDDASLPFGFGQTHTEDLRHWTGDRGHLGFERLLRSIESKVAAVPEMPDAARTQTGELTAFRRAVAAKSTAALQDFLVQYPGSVLAAAAQAAKAERRRRYMKRAGIAVFLLAVSAMPALYWSGAFGTLRLQPERSLPQVAEPLSEQQLKNLVERSLTLVALGQCSDSLMTQPLLNACKASLGQMQPLVARMGAIREVVNEGRHPSSASGGALRTRMLVTFERGQQRWEVLGSADGRLATFWTGG